MRAWLGTPVVVVVRTPVVVVPVHIGTIRTFESVLATRLDVTTIARLGGLVLGVATNRVHP